MTACPECGGAKDRRAKWCSDCRFNPERRFWRNVAKSESCWEWRGWTTGNGYGRFRVTGGRVLAHRYSYELLVGPIPVGMEIDHLCRNPSCVNPAHLEPVTHRENLLRGTSPAAGYARQTHCKRGHPFSPENTYIIPASGSRQCLSCKRAARAGNNARRRERRAACSRRLGL